jgi:predicted transposase YbfD/YdcC
VSTYFEKVPDPRGQSNAQVHLLLDILTIALCAMLSGAETFADMERFGLEKRQWLRERLGLKLPGGVPSHDTFGRLFARLDPHAFGAAMQTWTQALHHATQGQVVALDGKTLRRSFDSATGKGALHLVNAWASDSRLVLGQTAVDAKSNEITAIPTLLEMLDIKGCIITCDALNSQKEIARQIRGKEANYVLALKDNHALLHQEVRDYFGWCRQQPGGLARLTDSQAHGTHWGHGRCEVQNCFVIAATEQDWPQALRQWPGLQSIVLVESARRSESVPVNNSVPVQQRFYLSSLPCDAPTLLKAVREHWGVENNVHWCLDVAFDEDGSRVRKDHAAHNLAILRRLCLNLLRQETNDKRGLKAKRLRAAWNSDYLLKLLCGPSLV